jgi:hypothetical protein
MKHKLHFKLKKLLDPLKYWDVEAKKQFMPIVEYCESLKAKCEALENEIKRYQQPTLTGVYEDGLHVSKSFVRQPDEPRQELDEWLRQQFETGRCDSEKFKVFLKRKGWTIEQAREIAYKNSSSQV